LLESYEETGMSVIRALDGIAVDVDENDLHQAVREDLATAERVLKTHGAQV
jgi:hypothetical protein